MLTHLRRHGIEEKRAKAREAQANDELGDVAEQADQAELPPPPGVVPTLALGESLEARRSLLRARKDAASARLAAIRAELAAAKAKMGGTAATSPERGRFDELSRLVPHAEADLEVAAAAHTALVALLEGPETFDRVAKFEASRKASTPEAVRERAREELVPKAIELLRAAAELMNLADAIVNDAAIARIDATSLSQELGLLEHGIALGLATTTHPQPWDTIAPVHDALRALSDVRRDAALMLTVAR